MRILRLISTWAAVLAVACTARATPLPQLSIDTAETSVSGLSAGGYMAVQMHVAYSATFKKGAGIVAGGPFNCAEGSIVNATGRCMTHSSSIPVTSLIDTTRSWASSGSLDPVANLASSKVYMFSGTLDSVVKPAVMDDLLTYYRAFVPQANIVYKHDLAAEHAMVTDDYGSTCSTKGAPYINDCNFDLAGALLAQIYGTLNPRNNGTLAGSFIEFDQTAFISGHGMASTGWAFVPQACAAGTRCRLHVVLHGCKQNTAEVGQQYVRNTGYNRWADSNNIVMLYPQTSTSATNSCFDWFGYDNANYAKKTGPQMTAIKAMVDRVSSGSSTPSTLPAPVGVGTSGATSSSMVIAWAAVNGAAGYNVYRAGTKVNASLVAATSYTDTGLAAGTTYSWTVKAVDTAGAESPPSSPATGATTGSSATCYTASNYAHTTAGRARVSFGMAYANGSNQNMGYWNIYIMTTLKQTGPNHYVIGSCP